MSAELPWHAAYPAPRGAAPSISREELVQWIRDGKQAGKDFILVDLRRTDYEVWTVREKEVTSSRADVLKREERSKDH
jgi:arsenical-resistance protein 2